MRAAADVVFEFGTSTGARLDLNGGTHLVRRSTFATTLTDGIDAALSTSGTATVVNSVFGGGRDGIHLPVNTASVDVRYTTIASGTGVGIDNTAGGSVTVASSIVYDNALGDLLNVACGQVSHSDTESPDCSAVNSNVSADPQLGPDYRLGASSPCLERGPGASSYTGDPETDIDGGPRLIDHDGDGQAISDCGADERLDGTPEIGEVLNLRWPILVDKDRLEWDAVPSAVEYHVYRDLVGNLSYQGFGVCRDANDPVRTDTSWTDPTTPPPGAGLSYLITAESAGGAEGTLGFGTSAERSNFAPCP